MIIVPQEAFMADNVLTLEAASRIIEKYKQEGKTVGLCHGGFDLLHPGHILHFSAAKKICEILFVSVTSDRFLRGRKGESRPIFPQHLRTYTAAMVKPVDFVVISDCKNGVEVIEALKPDVYIKGPDYMEKQTPGICAERAAIVAAGGKIAYTTEPKLSTSDIITHIRGSE